MNIKNRILPWMLLLFLSPSLMQGQSLSAKVFFNSDTVSAVFLGIDFTLARLVNDDASSARVIQLTQFNGINDLIVKENKKYDLQEAYHRINWNVDLKEVLARNDKANPDSLKSTNEGDLTRLNDRDIDNLVRNFNYGTHKGYGVLLIVEGMNKTGKQITIWFTLIDMGAKKVLTAARVAGKLGSGFGFRNYWASAIKSAIHEVKSDDYDQWKAGAGSK
jgi:hypothetical protein